MHKVNEYKDHAKACRELATRTTLPSDEKILEELAQAWERIGRAARPAIIVEGLVSDSGAQ